MSSVGKIFDHTPSGETLKKRRNTALNKAIELDHDLSLPKRKLTKKENAIEWTCKKCNANVVMDFTTGTEFGSALHITCRGKSWL